MAIQRLILSVAVAALALSALPLANNEHRATVLMRNGERVAGLLEDVEGGVVFVRVSLHDQRRLGLDNVALIDFVGGATGLPETELSMARGQNHLAVLRDGSSITGQFIDIRGGESTAAAGENHSLIFRTTNGEERRITLDNVGRIYFGNFPGGSSASAADPGYTTGSPGPAGSTRVPGNAAWVPTPLNVRKGDQVRFNASGRIQLSDDASDLAQPAGSLKQRYAAGAPLPQNFAGALIARVGGTAPFPIGDQTGAVTMPADGQLYLGVNDDEVSDNRGEFTVSHALVRRR